MTTPVKLYRMPSNQVVEDGVPVIAMYGPVGGGFIVNPFDAGEPIFVSLVGDAELFESATTNSVQPGQSFAVPAGLTGNVSVNAATGGHWFSGFVIQEPNPYPPEPVPGDFPPTGVTTITQTIPAYLYQQYSDDDDLQAFVGAYNAATQTYVTWFANTPLAVYTSSEITGALLDWIAAGVYGMVRPSLASGRNRDLGPFNTYQFNTLQYNGRRRVGPQNVTVTTDDIFKRIMTWNFYKGDGQQMNVRWLKRRVMRFLIGTNGSAPNIDETYLISVTFGSGGTVTIRIGGGTRRAVGGAIFNMHGFNTTRFNELLTVFTPGPDPLPYQKIFKEAVESGVLQLPFQYTFNVAA